MDDVQKAEQVLDTLKSAMPMPTAEALPILNGLAGLIQGGAEQSFEVQEARADVFMAICELGKAMHRGLPIDALWAPAITAAERWQGLAARTN